MKEKVRPIRPDEVKNAKKASLPDVVLESFNELIAQNFSGNSATVKQNDVVELMIKKGLDRKEIFNNNWLDVDDVYRAEGWEVLYDKPGFNEDYPAKFIFKSKL